MDGRALAATGSVYELYRARGFPMSFATTLSLEFCQILTYAPLTPFAFALALRFPIQRGNWLRRSSLHFRVRSDLLIGTLNPSLRYSICRMGFQTRCFVSGIWNSQTHLFEIKWPIFRNLALTNIVDDITGTYLTIISGRPCSLVLLEIPRSRSAIRQA